MSRGIYVGGVQHGLILGGVSRGSIFSGEGSGGGTEEPAGFLIDAMTSPWVAGSGAPTITALGGEAGFNITADASVSTHKNLAFALDDECVALWFRENSGFYRFRVDLVAGGTNWSASRWQSPYFYSTQFTEGEWTQVTIPLIDFTAAGSAPPADWTDLRDVNISVERNSGEALSVDFRDLRKYPQTPADGPGVVWVFDDARLDTHDFVWPLLSGIGHVGVIPTPTNLMGGSNLGDGRVTMTWEQLHSMYDAGWQVCCHGHNHINLESADESTIIAETTNSYATLLAQGFDAEGARHYVYPGGGHNDMVVGQLVSQGYLSGRSTVSLKKGEAPNLGNVYRLQNAYVTSDKDTTYVTDVMDKLAARGGVSILTFHSFFEGAPANSWNWREDQFEAVVAHAGTLGLASYTLKDLWTA